MTKPKDWYSPQSIERFSKPQIKWLIPHLRLLRSGVYPRNPKDTGYTEGKSYQKRIFKRAKFETAAGIAAELDLRIQRAGWDGLLLEFLYQTDPDDVAFIINHIAEGIGEDFRAVDRRIDNALRYISGANRKDRSYFRFVRHERADP